MIYLDNAATTYPKPPIVYDRTFRFVRESMGNPGRGGHALSVAAGAVVDDARRKAARFFGVGDHRRLVFTSGCTDSIHMALRGWLGAGDHVIATTLDHNAVSRQLELLCGELRLQVTRVPFDELGRVDPARVQSEIRSNTTLIVLTHGSNVLGSVQPFEAFVRVSKDAGIPLLVDAAQTAGRIPVVESGARVFITCAVHKGLYGLPGLGILTVPEGVQLRKLRAGGTGTASESLTHPDEMPARLEAGTPSTPAIASLLYGLEFIESEGMERIHAAELSLARRLASALQNDPRFALYSRPDSPDRLAVVSFNLRNVSSQEVCGILDQSFGIAARGGLHCAAVLHGQLGTSPEGAIRVSPGYFNTTDEMDTLTDALRKIADAYP